MLAGIEAGGTKMVCAVSDAELNLKGSAVFPTTTPQETIAEMINYFRKFDIDAVGIGSFGPIDLNPKSPTYGNITKTPKTGWSDFDFVGVFKKAFGVPVGYDTDVNAAILGEVYKGAAYGCNNAIYITIGTGVGVGVYCNGGLVHGLVHPEAGHILLNRHPEDSFEGSCPFHKNCVEGMASGPAIEKRWGKSPKLLIENDKVWELEAYYIAQAVASYILTYSPEKVILWGGVMHQDKLFDMVRSNVKEILNGYVHSEMVDSKIDQYIVKPALGEKPGITGALCLARIALNGAR
ncbi:MAG: ROK family protein [Agathobacter sp.]|nr:ROK family protein [Agathobacter sp.]